GRDGERLCGARRCAGGVVAVHRFARCAGERGAGVDSGGGVFAVGGRGQRRDYGGWRRFVEGGRGCGAEGGGEDGCGEGARVERILFTRVRGSARLLDGGAVLAPAPPDVGVHFVNAVTG